MAIGYILAVTIIGPITERLGLLGHKQVTGREHLPTDAGCIIAAHHQHHLDPWHIAVGLKMKQPIHWLAKLESVDGKELSKDIREMGFSQPIARIFGEAGAWFTRHFHAIVIDRENPTSDVTIRGIKEALHILSEDGVIGIFPRGTTLTTPEAEDKYAGKGVEFFARISHKPVVPVWIDKKHIVIGEPLTYNKDTDGASGDFSERVKKAYMDLQPK